MMHEKRRYVLVESTMPIPESYRKEFEDLIYRELMRNIGEISYFKAAPKIIKYIGTNMFVLKCSLSKYNEIITALAFIKSIGSNETAFYTINGSGTIKALLKQSSSQRNQA